MIRQAPRYLLRQQPPFRSLQPIARTRFISTAPPAHKSRSWKSLGVRAGLAVGVVYYYNTSNLFAEEPAYAVPPPSPPAESTTLPTLDSLSQSSRSPKIAALSPTASPKPTSPIPPTQQEHAQQQQQQHDGPPPTPSLEETEEEEEASQQGAFNEETGEINWDCPCLGGMAHGPCGEHFRAAFSCFVFSKEEPKGMDCIEHFKTMQGCFREHPEEYGAEFDEEEEEEEGGGGRDELFEGDGGRVQGLRREGEGDATAVAAAATADTAAVVKGESGTRNGNVVPKAAVDATGANDGR